MDQSGHGRLHRQAAIVRVYVSEAIAAQTASRSGEPSPTRGKAGTDGMGHGDGWMWMRRMDMERIPEVVQLTDMWESDDESGEDGVGDGQVELGGN